MSQTTTYKVFVGNLSFKTKAEELAAEFSIAGKVVGANIISRGPRSLGYGFVEMENEEDANKCVTLLNKKNIDGRDINVEVAKPRDESKLGERRVEGGDAGGLSPSAAPRRGRGGRGRGRGSRGGRGRGGNGRGGARGQEVGAPPENTDGSVQPAPSGANNNANANANNNNNNNNNNSNNGEGARRRYRARSRSGGRGGRGGRYNNRQPREDFRTPSTTTLFVANLPFSLDDAGLLELFKTNNPAKAHVVLNRNGRSKGFGFVEFNNPEDQAAAAAAEKKTVDNRELIVKIALTSDTKSSEVTDDSQQSEAQNSEAPKTN